MWEAARTHASVWSFVRLELLRVLYSFHGFEIPNNVDFYVFRHAAPVLDWLFVPFWLLVPLAGVGLASRRWRCAWPIFIAIAAHVITMVLANPLSRYRAGLAVALVPLAGVGIVHFAGWLRGRAWLKIFVALAASGLYLVFALTPIPGYEPLARSMRYAQLAEGALAMGEVELAELHLIEAARLQPEDAALAARLEQVRALAR